MITEIALFILFFAAVWYQLFRPRSPYNVRPSYRLLTAAPALDKKPLAFDYVVVGAGPAGIAAARTLLEESAETGATVLIVDKGSEGLPRGLWQSYTQAANRGRLLSFSPDMVFLPTGGGVLPGKLGRTLAGPCIEEGCVAHRPFRFPPSEDDEAEQLTSSQKNAAARVMDLLFSYTPYPRGVGVGGTTQLEWGLHLPSIFTEDVIGVDSAVAATDVGEEGTGVQGPWWQVPVSLPKIRNPLSWAFAESAAASLVKEKYMATPTAPCRRNAVYPALLRIDADGRRLPVEAALLRGASAADLDRLHILVRHRVTAVETQEAADGVSEEDKRPLVVSAIQCAGVGGMSCTIAVRKGVVFCGGVVHTPRLLRGIAAATPSPLTTGTGAVALHHPVELAPTHVRVRDALALPMIFAAQSKVSMDAVNAQDTKSSTLWYLTQRGPFLQALADTIASVPVPSLGAEAEIRFLLLPFGGRDPRRYYQLGWDRTLGSFDEAATILMVLTGVDGLTHPLELPTADGFSVGTRHVLDQRRMRPLAVLEEMAAVDSAGDGNMEIELPAPLREKVLTALVQAMRSCRRLTATDPLSHLLPARGGSVNGKAGQEAMDYALLKQDPSKAVHLARLMHTPRGRRSNKMRRDLVGLLEWAYDLINTDSYMREYVAKHAYWLGMGSGSSEPFMRQEEGDTSLMVHGLGNAAVGDCSAVTEAVWAAGGKDSLAAGGVNTAISLGRRAAQSLLAQKESVTTQHLNGVKE